MKKSKEMYNRALAEYTLSDEKLKALQNVLAEILRDIDGLCRKYGIRYMLGGGTCLGAVRHKGFIPWDDDADIIMYKEDMLRLCDAVRQELPGKYTPVLPYSAASPDRMMKLFLNGTVYKEIGKENMPGEHKVFADIFPVVNLPDSDRKINKNHKKHFFSSRMMSLCYDSKYPSAVVLEKCKTNRELKKYYRFRRLAGRMGRIFFGTGFWRKRTSRFEEGLPHITGREGIPCALSYKRECFDSGFFAETIEWDFEGMRLFIPKRYDEYLKNLYGDYMRVPSPEKREKHLAAVIDLNGYENTV